MVCFYKIYNFFPLNSSVKNNIHIVKIFHLFLDSNGFLSILLFVIFLLVNSNNVILFHFFTIIYSMTRDLILLDLSLTTPESPDESTKYEE
jgi:hypothetical protein